MGTKFIWVVHFEEADFNDLDCAFDSFEKAKEAVQTIFDKVSAINPAWQVELAKLHLQLFSVGSLQAIHPVAIELQIMGQHLYVKRKVGIRPGRLPNKEVSLGKMK